MYPLRPSSVLRDEDVRAAYERAVEGGAEPVTEPRTTPWGQQVAYVRDRDGNLIELASPI